MKGEEFKLNQEIRAEMKRIDCNSTGKQARGRPEDWTPEHWDISAARFQSTVFPKTLDYSHQTSVNRKGPPARSNKSRQYPSRSTSKGSHSDARDLIHLLKSDRPMARWPNVSPFHTSFYFKNIRTLALLLAPSQKQQTYNNLTRKDLTIFGNSCILLPFFQINLRWAESTCISPQKNLDPHLFGMRFTAKDLLWCFTKSTEARDWLGSCNQTSEWGGNHENYGKSMGNSTVKSCENEEIDLL